ncbi:hypothetical protein [Azospirillum sp. TSA2s]|uniref:hypothetical protein n=1 Tax=Azospirillum sp. TSA2s TaxID=709810 RepID=UPI0035280D17
MQLASQLAEIGVILLMCGVGLHFSLNDLMKVRSIAISGAVVQIAIATAMGWGLARFLGWNLAADVRICRPHRCGRGKWSRTAGSDLNTAKTPVGDRRFQIRRCNFRRSTRPLPRRPAPGRP